MEHSIVDFNRFSNFSFIVVVVNTCFFWSKTSLFFSLPLSLFLCPSRTYALFIPISQEIIGYLVVRNLFVNIYFIMYWLVNSQVSDSQNSEAFNMCFKQTNFDFDGIVSDFLDLPSHVKCLLNLIHCSHYIFLVSPCLSRIFPREQNSSNSSVVLSLIFAILFPKGFSLIFLFGYHLF